MEFNILAYIIQNKDRETILKMIPSPKKTEIILNLLMVHFFDFKSVMVKS